MKQCNGILRDDQHAEYLTHRGAGSRRAGLFGGQGGAFQWGR